MGQDNTSGLILESLLPGYEKKIVKPVRNLGVGIIKTYEESFSIKKNGRLIMGHSEEPRRFRKTPAYMVEVTDL